MHGTSFGGRAVQDAGEPFFFNAAFPHEKQMYLDKYRSDCLTPGNRVQLITPASRQEAFALEIDDEFRLVVELADGTRKALSSGEVSVRGMYGYV